MYSSCHSEFNKINRSRCTSCVSVAIRKCGGRTIIILLVSVRVHLCSLWQNTVVCRQALPDTSACTIILLPTPVDGFDLSSVSCFYYCNRTFFLPRQHHHTITYNGVVLVHNAKEYRKHIIFPFYLYQSLHRFS